ncbi:MAG TPA: IPT/TIG domain-containing protein [Streptosporangiaceae bacterium]|nr:IPT/TIG domain-containing protein [Streptosporangiaceae bacterium]
MRRDKIRLRPGRWLAILTVSVVVAGLGQAAISPAHASPTGSNFYSWGLNVSGELGNGTTVNSDVPVQVTLPGGATAVAVAMGGDPDALPDPGNASLAIGSDGNLYSWGDNLDGELGTGQLPTYNSAFQCTASCNSTTPVKVDFPSGLSPIAISVGAEHDLALASNGSIYEWGLVEEAIFNEGLGSTVQPTPVVVALPGGGRAAAIAAGSEDDVALGSNGTVYDWGDNTYGELGDGSNNPDETGPVQVSLPSGVTATSVATGQTSSVDETSLAIGSDGHIYEWGYGVGNAPGPGDVPVAVSLPSGVTPTAIATDDGTNLAIGSDGNAYEWSVDSLSPQEVVLPPGVTAAGVSAGWGTDIVVGGNGQLYAWGSDNDGQYGNGTTGDGQSTPVDVSTAGEPGFSSVVQGVYAVAAVGSGGAVSAPVFGSATPALDTIAGTAYSSVFYATGDPAYGLADAPSWLSITANGAVTGTPPAGTTTFSYSVTATNGGGSASLGPFTVTVQPSTTISGQVTGTAAAGVADAVVQSCMAVTGDECQSTTTSSSGTFTIDAAVSSSVVITAFPPQGSSLVQTSTDAIAVPPSGVANETISLGGIAPLPAGVSVDNTTGTPTVYWASPAPVTATGCSGGVGLLSVVGQDTSTGLYTASLYPLSESPAGSGNYVGTLPPQEPVHGPVEFETSSTCPPVSALVPDSGPATGGTSVTITGSGFAGASAVDFGSTPATSFSVTSDGAIKAVAPPGSGTVPVTVTAGASLQIAGQYTYMAILSVTPPSGPAGSTVVITGTGIGSASQVSFGGNAADFTQVGPNEIQAVVPPGSGSADVTVSTPYGSGSTPVTPADEFDYGPTLSPAPVPPPPPVTPPPVAGEASQANSLAAQINTVANSVFLKAAPDEVQDLVTVLQAIVNPSCKNSQAAAVAVVTSNPAVADVSESFAGDLSELVLTSSYVEGLAAGSAAAALAPVIVPLVAGALVGYMVEKVVAAYLEASIDCQKSTVQSAGGGRPSNGFIDPSGTVLDTNGNPVSGATVTILRAGTSAGPYVPVSTAAAGIEPAVNPETTGSDGVFHWDVYSGWYEVQASAPGCTDPADPDQPAVTIGPYPVPPPQVGLTITLACANEPAAPVPAVTSLSQSSGPPGGGITLTILGTGFTPSSVVTFGGTDATGMTYLSPQALSVTAPAGSGMVDVQVQTAGGTSAKSPADQFFYGSPPAVTGLSPSSGPVAGGTAVTITGTGFTSATAVGFGGIPATSFTVVSGTQIRATAPAEPAGTADITVTTPAGPSAPVTADQYTYQSPPPAIDGEVTAKGGTTVTAELTTAGSGDLIVAFVAGDGPSFAAQTAKVSGGGLTWTLARRTNTRNGTAEVWEARASGAMTRVPITSSLAFSIFSQVLTVVAFKNAPGTGATASMSGGTGAPSGILTTTVPNSWVFAVATDTPTIGLAPVGANTAAVTPGSSQTLIAEATASDGDTSWVQSRTTPTPAAGTAVTINDTTTPANGLWNLTLIEIT